MGKALRRGGLFRKANGGWMDAQGNPATPPTAKELKAAGLTKGDIKSEEDVTSAAAAPAPPESDEALDSDGGTGGEGGEFADPPQTGGEGAGADDVFGDDYPGASELKAQKITSRAAVRAMTDDDLKAVNGIGPATLKSIRAIDPHEAPAG